MKSINLLFVFFLVLFILFVIGFIGFNYFTGVCIWLGAFYAFLNVAGCLRK